NAILYHRPEGPSHPDADPRRLAATAPLAAAINSWSKPGTPLFFADRDLAVWIGIHDLRVDAVEWLPSDPASASLVGAFLVAMPAPAADTWARLESHAYHAADVRTEEGIVAIYGSANPVHLTSAGALTFGDVRLEASAYPAALCPGDVLPVELAASGPIAPNVKVSARLLAPQGETVAQNDKLLAPHTRMGLFLPPDRPAAAYTLAFLLYDAGTLAPFLTGEGRDLNHLVTLEPCTHQKP
ncbi:MAG TPA: hypothetical protein VER55_02555, partial [Ardenticatenaceae bacterium]|nr:hypothetical protein [Ardenticatenaceae bacterium]